MQATRMSDQKRQLEAFRHFDSVGIVCPFLSPVESLAPGILGFCSGLFVPQGKTLHHPQEELGGLDGLRIPRPPGWVTLTFLTSGRKT